MALIPYWLLPLISAVVWVGTLLAMLITWLAQGHPRYPTMDPTAHVAFISDIGAELLKPLFIAGSSVTGVFFFLTLAAERYLRHKGRIVANSSTVQKVLSVGAMVGAAIGTAGLILLSVFDTLRHPRLHDTFLLVFMIGVLLSAVFTVIEFWLLERHDKWHRGLVWSFWMKVFFFFVELALAVAFGVLKAKQIWDTDAILEWIVAIVFVGYLLIFLFDLHPASRRRRHNQDLEKRPMDASF